MKTMKKAVAVLAVAVMAMAMSIMAFADQQITIHFNNPAGWSTVGAWVYEGVAFDTNVSPADKCAVVNGDKQLWPGAKCDDEGNGWVKITCTVSDDFAANGGVFIFNNWVADNTLNDTTTQEDLDKLAASGILCDSTKKEQTPNTMLLANTYAGVNEFWLEWNGENAGTPIYNADGGLVTEAPASYAGGDIAPAPEETTAATEETTVAATEETTAAATETTATATTAQKPAPTTGDVAPVAVMVALLAAVAVVVAVAKKKEA